MLCSLRGRPRVLRLALVAALAGAAVLAFELPRGTPESTTANRPPVLRIPADSQFVATCKRNLCINGAPYRIKGATAYGQYGSPAAVLALAKAGRLNTIELVEFQP